MKLASRYLREPLAAAFARELDELHATCQREERAARALPTVAADFCDPHYRT